jgi:uncharacterized membrane protein
MGQTVDPRRTARIWRLHYLWRGLPGHPLHPPFTDALIGTYTFALIAAVLSLAGMYDDISGKAAGLAVWIGIWLTIPTAITGIVDWWRIRRRHPLWTTGLLHLVSTVVATLIFFVAYELGAADFEQGEVPMTSFVLMIVAFAFLTLGGWLGGVTVFVYGMRVLHLQDEPVARAISPLPYEEKAAADRRRAPMPSALEQRHDSA